MRNLQTSQLAKILLLAGALAGPVFTLVWLITGATRADYDPLRHPISSLAIGAYGWTQAVNFFITGILVLAFALGLRQQLRTGPGATWGPLLVAFVGLGLLGAGLFVTDPMSGYPPGTVALPLDYTLPGRLHRLFSAFVFLGLPGAGFVLARRFRQAGQRLWANYSIGTAIAFILLFILTSLGFGQVAGFVAYGGLLQRITLTVGWAWLTLLAIHLLKAGVHAAWPGFPLARE